jgi:hypothetical protein
LANQPKKKKPNLDRSKNFDVDAWRDRQVRIRTEQFFYDQSDLFAEEHENDTDEELKAYVKTIAVKLNRMPMPIEVPGGYFIEQRLGKWLELADEFGVKKYQTSARYKESSTRTYRDEYKRQEILFREERKRKKAEKAAKKQKNTAQ